MLPNTSIGTLPSMILNASVWIIVSYTLVSSHLLVSFYLVFVVVFNTEAHPFIAPPAKPVYGSGKTLASNGPFKAQAGPPLPAISPSAKQPQGVKVPSQANSPQ